MKVAQSKSAKARHMTGSKSSVAYSNHLQTPSCHQAVAQVGSSRQATMLGGTEVCSTDDEAPVAVVIVTT